MVVDGELGQRRNGLPPLNDNELHSRLFLKWRKRARSKLAISTSVTKII